MRKRQVKHLIVTAAAQVANRKSEERVFFGQELGGASVESDGSSGETNTSASPAESSVSGVLANHEEKESKIEEGKEGNQGDVDPQGSQEEDEGKNEPRSQKDPDGVRELTRVISISS